MDRERRWNTLTLSCVNSPYWTHSARTLNNRQTERIVTTRSSLTFTKRRPVKNFTAYRSPILKARRNFDEFYKSIQPGTAHQEFDYLRTTQEPSFVSINSGLENAEGTPPNEVSPISIDRTETLKEQFPELLIDSIANCIEATDFSVVDAA